MNTVMNLRVSYMAGNSSDHLKAYQLLKNSTSRNLLNACTPNNELYKS
jgi:hypothetical protein